MKVLVTDGGNRAALAITRSLGRAGHTVVVGEKETPSLAQTSRYCSDRLVYPDPVTRSDEFVAFLASAVKARAIDVLLPVSDITTFLVTENRDCFDRRCAIPFASAEIVQRAANKVDLMQTAMRIGVPVPRTMIVCDADSIPRPEFPYPVVIKPWKSRVRTPAGWVSTAVGYADSFDNLVRELKRRPKHEFPVMLQERIAGPGVGVFACYQEGRAVALFSHRRLRERPPWGGVSVLSESVPLPPLASDYATRLLDEIGWHGVAMVEFKQDARDDVPKLMEINGRFWGSLQLAIDAGVDFPRVLVEMTRSERVQRQAPYRVGVRSRWLWGDVDSLLVTLFGGQRVAALGGQSRWGAIREFVKFWQPDLRYENPSLRDLRPWFFETYAWFRTAARDAVRRS
ncbi:MAG TPA: ATP-grasp domain-containing protein [Vicinamibacterales bacterium]|jgi:predicted ATP-grasp superfamily ATP-dependent carboligase